MEMNKRRESQKLPVPGGACETPEWLDPRCHLAESSTIWHRRNTHGHTFLLMIYSRLRWQRLTTCLRYTHTHRCLANLSRSIFNDAKASEQLSGRCFQAFRQSSLRKKTEAAMVFDFSCAPFCLYGTRAEPNRFACQTAALLDSVAVLY